MLCYRAVPCAVLRCVTLCAVKGCCQRCLPRPNVQSRRRRECPGVFARFVADPPTDKATLTIKSLGQQQQQRSSSSSSSGNTDVVLSGVELQQLQRQLLQVLSGIGPPGAPAAAAAADRVCLRPVNSSSSTPSSIGGPAKLELLIDGGAAAQLQQAHVVSLVTVIEDLMGQLPEQYASSTQQQAVQVSCWLVGRRSVVLGWGALQCCCLDTFKVVGASLSVCPAHANRSCRRPCWAKSCRAAWHGSAQQPGQAQRPPCLPCHSLQWPGPSGGCSCCHPAATSPPRLAAAPRAAQQQAAAAAFNATSSRCF